MHIRDLSGKNKNICILGFGREGKSILRALERYVTDAAIVIADADPSVEPTNYPFITGSDYLEQIDRQNFWVIIKSPGIPPHPFFKKWRGKMTSATQLFLDSIKDTGATVIGVTGSKGKSTTSSLIAHILKEAGKDVHLVGNIGKPVLDFLEAAKQETIFVQEMSSFQLMDLTVSPPIAVITSFFPEHLDYHHSIDAYLEAKKHITQFQSEDDLAYFPATSPGAASIAKEGKGRKIPFMEADAPVAIGETLLLGSHNLSNIAAAAAVTTDLGVPKQIVAQAVKSFQPLPHRLQSLGVHGNYEWVDDAISTTPESTIAALGALGDRVTTLLLGGQDRGSDFRALAERISASNIQAVILFPDSGSRIREALESLGTRAQCIDVRTMKEAVAAATKFSIPSPSKPVGRSGVNPQSSMPHVVLLSPASPSYNMYKNFEEKGKAFREAILGMFKL